MKRFFCFMMSCILTLALWLLPAVAEEATACVTNGTSVYALDYEFMLLDAQAETGWFTVSGFGKGYGTQYYAILPEQGVVIEGEEGAEVVLCENGIVQFVWRDAAGNRVSAWDMYCFSGEAPIEATIYAVIYDFEGNVIEERPLTSMAQSEEDPYYTKIYPLMQDVVSELGGGEIAGSAQMLMAEDDGGDAVVRGDDGNELVRIPNCSADMTFAFLSTDGSCLSVIRPDNNTTEIIRLAPAGAGGQ